MTNPNENIEPQIEIKDLEPTKDIKGGVMAGPDGKGCTEGGGTKGGGKPKLEPERSFSEKL